MNQRLQHAAQFKEIFWRRDKNLCACSGDSAERRKLKVSKIAAFCRKPLRRNKKRREEMFFAPFVCPHKMF
jgi:hypothetical protein